MQLEGQAERAIFSLLNKGNELAIGLPVDVQLELFDKTILPVMLYGCEVLGYENINVYESFYFKISEMYIKIKEIYPNSMLY